MFSQSELIFRIEIKCAIFKRIIASKPASVTRRLFLREKTDDVMC
jgi:hypothetical protein